MLDKIIYFKIVIAKIVFLFSAFYFLFSVIRLPSSVSAAGACQPLYGGGQYGACPPAPSLLVNKKVANPKTNVFIENLSIKDPRFAPNQTVSFQIAVMNNGQSPITKIIVEDVFPQFVNFTSGSGSFDQKTRTLSFDINNLVPNELRSFTITGQIVNANSLPQDKTVTCVVNQVSVFATDNPSGISRSSSQLCIERTLLPVFPAPSVQTTPPTGPEALPLLLLMPTAVTGIFLRKKSHFN